MLKEKRLEYSRLTEQELKLTVNGKEYTIQYKPSEAPESGFTAICKERKGAITEAENIEQLENNMTEVIEMLDEIEELDKYTVSQECRKLISDTNKWMKEFEYAVDLEYTIKKAYKLGFSDGVLWGEEGIEVR
jgi:hypothetical protein